ncbi:MAG: carboxypeptidase regulatory-like domain-containing protein, partial [Armatimonadota bacterium]
METPASQRRILECGDCPEVTARVETMQSASGPDPNDDLTGNATATQEIEPDAAPVLGQNRVAFVSNGEDLDGDNLIDPVLPADADFDLWQMIPDPTPSPGPQGVQQKKVIDLPGDQREPAYDPGGRLLAYASNETGNWEIYTVEISTGVIWQITGPPGNKRHPTWSYDGQWLAFQSDVNGQWDIYKIDSTGAGRPQRLTSTSQDETKPAWSPTSNVIAYQVDMPSGSNIYSIDSEGGSQTQLTNGAGNPDIEDIDPAWSADGNSLLFASTRPAYTGDPDDDFNVWSVLAAGEVAGPEPSLVSDGEPDDEGNSYDDTWPTWAPGLIVNRPDGTIHARDVIVYQSLRMDETSSEPDVWARFVDDNTPVQLKSLPEAEPRILSPGNDVVVSVEAYDKGTGVNQIFAEFKDPDLKIYDIRPNQPFESNFSGTRYLERDCQTMDAIELRDDGVDPDRTANDGVFTGVWTTLPTQRDYIIDIQVTDNSPTGNPFEYDDVWGFSTKTFNPDDRVLFVDDYCEGQLFIEETGNNFDWLPTPWPVESYWRYNPGYVPGIEHTIDFDSIAGPFDESYDVWRILCRGPIPDHIFRNYLPTVEYQLDPADARANPQSAVADREVLVANRMIIWAAPHAGNVWIGPGTIQDAATQAKLGNFLDMGGRLLIGGEDIAFALTLGGKVENAFLRDYLRADYASDVGGGGWAFTLGGRENDPIAWDAYAESGRTHPGADIEWPPHWYDTGDNPIELVTPQTPVNQPCLCDAAHYSQRPDIITPIGDTKIYGYGGFDGAPAATRYRNETTGSRMAYFAFGFEQIHRRYHSPSNLPDHCQNHRSHLIHNAKCWMRTGAFQGQVVSISEGAQPVTNPNPLVIAIQGDREYAVRCEDDGTYIMQGLNPGRYSFEVIRTGYEVDHASWSYVHGGRLPVQIDFAIKESQPGAISGTVTAEATGDYLRNVELLAYRIPEPEDDDGDDNGDGADTTQADGQYDVDELEGPIGEPAYSAADGTFRIPDLTAGDYVVVADGSEIGYGSQQIEVEVVPGSTSNVTFALGAADGTLSVHVTDVEKGTDIENALVEVYQNDQLIGDRNTDETGMANISLQPGTYQVFAGASGYETAGPEGTTITSLQTSELEFALETVDPGAVAGLVTSATSGSIIPDVTIHVISGGEVIATTQTENAKTDPGDGTEANFRIPDDAEFGLPAGRVTVRPETRGFQARPEERVVEINSGELTSGVNFVLESLHVFPSGLQLMSIPWDYSDEDPATLLDIPAGQLAMA